MTKCTITRNDGKMISVPMTWEADCDYPMISADDADLIAEFVDHGDYNMYHADCYREVIELSYPEGIFEGDFEDDADDVVFSWIVEE